MAETEQNDEQDDLAAEYVLGTLDAAERAEVEDRLRTDPQLARAVAAWARRLDPLIAAVPPVAPPTGTFAAITAKIDALAEAQPEPAPKEETPPQLQPERPAPPRPISRPKRRREPGAEIIQLRREIRTWRYAAIAASAIAATLAIFIGLREVAGVGGVGESFVAVLESEDRNPAFVAAVNVEDKSITIMRISGQSGAAPGQSHELWALGGGRDAPQSLGLLDASANIPAAKLGELDPTTLEATTFAVSIEPEGGSPTGQPTGPVVFTGKLVPVPAK